MRIERIVETLCKECEKDCERRGTVPECYNRSGTPCSDFLDKMDEDDKEEDVE